jgi:hypothetical protein
LKVRLLVFWLIVLFYYSAVHAQLPYFHGDAQTLSLADAGAVLSSHWSCLNNPAGITGINSIQFGITYENYYSVPELGMGAIAIGIPGKSGNFGLGFSTFGNSCLSQSHTALSYGRHLGKIIQAGIGLHYLLIRQPEDYQDLYAVLPSVGLQSEPIKNLIVGIYTFNPANQHYLPAGDQVIPAGWYAGAGYHFGDEVMICMEMQKAVHSKAQYCGGIEIQLRKKVLFRFGIRPGSYAGYTLGVGFRNDHLNVDMAIMKHPVLSYSSALTLSFKLNSHAS